MSRFFLCVKRVYCTATLIIHLNHLRFNPVFFCLSLVIQLPLSHHLKSWGLGNDFPKNGKTFFRLAAQRKLTFAIDVPQTESEVLSAKDFLCKCLRGKRNLSKFVFAAIRSRDVFKSNPVNEEEMILFNFNIERELEILEGKMCISTEWKST